MLFTGLVLFLILSAFFSGSEIAFISASRLGVQLKKNSGSRRGRILASFYERPKRFLGAMLVGNNIALVIFTFLATQLLRPVLVPMLGEGLSFLLASTLLITVVVLIFGEFIPKNLFRLYANNMLYALTYPLLFFQKLLRFPTWLVTKMTNGILKFILKEPVQESIHVLGRVDLENYIKDTLGEDDEDIDKSLLNNALGLNNTRVRECMIPRNEIRYIDISSSLDDLLGEFVETNLSRIIIVDGDIENIMGYIHHQQLLKNPKKLKSLVLEMPFVPEAMNVRDLMLKFIKLNKNIACVVDEYGSTAGLITLEDILEEIFGEIEDEHDSEDHIEKVVSDREFIFSGRLEIDYLNEKYEQIDIPEGEYHTLSGYLVMTSGSIPESGAILELDGYTFVLELVSDTRIEAVRVIKQTEGG